MTLTEWQEVVTALADFVPARRVNGLSFQKVPVHFIVHFRVFELYGHLAGHTVQQLCLACSVEQRLVHVCSVEHRRLFLFHS